MKRVFCGRLENIHSTHDIVSKQKPTADLTQR